MVTTHLGMMFELIPIYAAAVAWGIVAGLVAVALAMPGRGRMTIAREMGLVAMAAILAALAARQPEFAGPTLRFAAIAAAWMAAADLAARLALDRFRPGPRLTPRGRRWAIAASLAALIAGLILVGTGFDLPPLDRRGWEPFAWLAGIIAAGTVLDLTARALVLEWHAASARARIEAGLARARAGGVGEPRRVAGPF